VGFSTKKLSRKASHIALYAPLTTGFIHQVFYFTSRRASAARESRSQENCRGKLIVGKRVIQRKIEGQVRNSTEKYPLASPRQVTVYNWPQKLDHVLRCKNHTIIYDVEDTQMTKKRRRFSSDFKFRVALEAAKGQRTLSELSGEYSIHPNQIRGVKP